MQHGGFDDLFPCSDCGSLELGARLETAAIVANPDLVITVGTSVAHLVGAMGKPVWILITR